MPQIDRTLERLSVETDRHEKTRSRLETVSEKLTDLQQQVQHQIERLRKRLSILGDRS